MSAPVLTVSKLNEYVSSLLSLDPVLRDVRLAAEVSGLRKTAAGHLYFSLKDESALIRCVMFRSSAMALPFMPAEGMKVQARGYVSLYPRDGQYQFYVQSLEQQGAGALYARFEQLKARLEAQGYFAPERKKPLPAYPGCIGIVTSATGAVIHDIQKVARRRNPNVRLLLCPAKVQGEGASEEIARAIGMLNTLDEVDAIIVGRGGGSIEDLWAFNEEIVADAIFASDKPVISAVGHQTDFTIADFVADLRAPTPSAAAELAVPDLEELLWQIQEKRERMRSALKKQINFQRSRVAQLRSSPAFLHPRRLIENDLLRLDHLQQRLQGAWQNQKNLRGGEFAQLCARLQSVSPLAVLSRGYALLQDEEGTVLQSTGQFKEGQIIHIRLKDGRARAAIEQIVPAGEEF